MPKRFGSVAGYPLLYSKSAVVAEAATVFRESDKRTFRRQTGEEAPLRPDELQESEDIETTVEYAHNTAGVIDRLEIMGFTLRRAEAEFNAIRLAEYEAYETREHDDSDSAQSDPWLEILRDLTFNFHLLKCLVQAAFSVLAPHR